MRTCMRAASNVCSRPIGRSSDLQARQLSRTGCLLAAASQSRVGPVPYVRLSFLPTAAGQFRFLTGFPLATTVVNGRTDSRFQSYQNRIPRDSSFHAESFRRIHSNAAQSRLSGGEQHKQQDNQRCGCEG